MNKEGNNVTEDDCALKFGWQQRVTQSLYHPSPCWGGEENGKKKEKNIMGWDKGSFTEQQTKRTVTATILIRRTHETNSGMDRATLTVRHPTTSQAATNFNPLASSPTWNPA